MRKIPLISFCIIVLVTVGAWTPNALAVVEICDNLIDDNDNGLIDCADPECDPPSIPPEGEFGDPTCSDGIDNDCDLLIDAQDPDCEPPESSIDLLKEVSVDGGATFFDANDGASAPVAVFGGGALYRLTVTNTGTSDLVNVVINDATLGIVDFLVGDLAAGETVVLTAGEIPQLDQPGRCQDPGDVTNIATVNGDSVDTGNPVMDSDPAVVRCEAVGEPAIDIRKQAEGPDSRTFPSGSDVSFEIVVTNTGAVDLENAVVTDSQVPDCERIIGYLATGDSVTYPCTAPNVTMSFENVACVTGEHNGVTVEDCDPSNVEVTPLNVYLDVKPESCPNPLNVKSKGLVPVAILGTEEFDVTLIDPSSLRLLGEVAPIRWDLEDVATPFNGVSCDDCLDCTELGPDGLDDLTVKFKAQEIIAVLGDVEDGECILLELTGETIDGIPISGTDIGLIINK